MRMAATDSANPTSSNCAGFVSWTVTEPGVTDVQLSLSIEDKETASKTIVVS